MIPPSAEDCEGCIENCTSDCFNNTNDGCGQDSLCESSQTPPSSQDCTTCTSTTTIPSAMPSATDEGKLQGPDNLILN